MATSFIRFSSLTEKLKAIKPRRLSDNDTSTGGNESESASSRAEQLEQVSTLLVDIRRELAALRPLCKSPQELQGLASMLHTVGFECSFKHRLVEDGAPFVEEALAIRRAVYGKNKACAQLVDSLVDVAMSLQRRGRFSDAAALFGEALAMHRKVLLMKSMKRAAHLSTMLGAAGKAAGGKAAAAAAAAARSNNSSNMLLSSSHDNSTESPVVSPVTSPTTSPTTMSPTTTTSPEAAAAAAAARELHEEYADDDTRVAALLGSIGTCQTRCGRNEAALSAFTECLEVRMKLHKGKADFEDVAKTLVAIAKVLTDMLQFEAALQRDREALEIRRRIKNKLGVSHSLNRVGSLLSQLGRDEEALALLFEAEPIVRHASQDRATRELVGTLSNIAAALATLKRTEEAMRYEHEALRLFERLYGGGASGAADNEKEGGFVRSVGSAISIGISTDAAHDVAASSMSMSSSADDSTSASVGSASGDPLEHSVVVDHFLDLDLEATHVNLAQAHLASANANASASDGDDSSASRLEGFRAALHEFESALHIQRNMFPNGDRVSASLLCDMAKILIELGRVSEAEARIAAGIEMFRKFFGQGRECRAFAAQVRECGQALVRASERQKARGASLVEQAEAMVAQMMLGEDEEDSGESSSSSSSS